MVRDARLVLVAEDDRQLQTWLVRLLTKWGYETIAVSTCAAASTALQRSPEVVLLDLRLEDGIALELAEEMAHMLPSPEVIVVSGTATAVEGFELHRLGARKYLQKPFLAGDLEAAIRDVRSEAAEYEMAARHAVPVVGMRDLMTNVRLAAIDQAVAMADGNHTAAAELLGVSRQAVQKALRQR